MDIKEIKTWNSFKWEEIFREIDDEISAYFREIPNFIDLPEEESLLMDRLLKGGRSDEYYDALNRLLSSPENMDTDDFAAEYEFFSMQYQTRENRHESEIFNELNSLASEWAETLSENSCVEIPTGVDILSQYGIALKDATYLVEAPQEFGQFIAAIAKRLHARINALARMMESIGAEDLYLSLVSGRHLQGLARLKDKTAELCCLDESGN